MSSKYRGGGQTCVPGCDNTLRDKNVSFHAFPANEKEKKGVVINQLSPSFPTAAKRKETSSKTASARPLLLLNELEIGCVVDVPKCNQLSNAVSKEPTQLTF
ncbi:hypothetical protein V5799_006103 [Amblyomma americanum]|uniref:Uncharacterized protein n=1 Tax=Amblyomma americanum TaxID=6943 RepID=A0AAQ4DXC8_AMBAM